MNYQHKDASVMDVAPSGLADNFSYEAALKASQRVNWKIEDIIGGDKKLDFTKMFMPESLARVESLEFLSADERRILNQIRGHEYLYIFGLVEEFILPFVLDHARPDIHGDDHKTRAFLQFASEEAKHIHLFKIFREEFQKDFGTTCDVIGPAEDIANAVLAHHPLSVALVILHIEWMTQRHYIESVQDNNDLDPQFKSLLKHHWREEAQHAQLDTLMVEALADSLDEDEIKEAIEGYAKIGGLLDGGLMQQVEFDLDCFQHATGRILSDEEREEFKSVQGQAVRWSYLGSGMTHPKFLKTIDAICPGAAGQVEAMVPSFC